MIKSITIENYKSIQKLDIDLGRLTVLIGANGAGKSNILEAFALSSAAANDKLDNEYLYNRGIRVTDDPRFMRAAFEKRNVDKNIRIVVQGNDMIVETLLKKDNNEPYSSWEDLGDKPVDVEFLNNFLGDYIAKEVKNVYSNKSTSKIPSQKKQEISKSRKKNPEKINIKISDEVLRTIFRDLTNLRISPLNLDKFIIYSPELNALRTFKQEGQIEPLGINGEGLFKLLRVLNKADNKEQLNELKDNLKLIDWFYDFEIPVDLTSDERRLSIKDKYLDSELAYFDQTSSNEGFLFLLFYFCLFISKETPKFFAIDNIDASLNPKLCIKLMIELNKLAKKYNKQAIFTTHNPAILDGLNLNDEEQKLYVVTRNKSGHTTVKPVFKPKLVEGQKPVKLSESFLRGYIGGLPKNF
jgi:AAA15 family ATPase/GTPase